MGKDKQAIAVEVMSADWRDGLSQDDRVFVEQQLTEIGMLLKRTWVEVTQRLIEIKGKIGDSAFYRLVQSEDFKKFAHFGFGKTEVYARIQAYTEFTTALTPTVGIDLDPEDQKALIDQHLSEMPVDSRARRQLIWAESDIKQELQQEVLNRAIAGEKFNDSKVKSVIQEIKKEKGLQPGQTMIVIDEESPLYGQSVVIEKVDGFTVDVEAQGESKRFIVTDLATELPDSQPVCPMPTFEKPVKRSPIEDMANEIILLTERVNHLEDLLRRIAGSNATMPAALRNEIEEAIA